MVISEMLLRIIITITYAEHLKTDPNVILSIFLQGLIQDLIVRESRQLHSYRFLVGCGLPQFLMLSLLQTMKKALKKTSVY